MPKELNSNKKINTSEEKPMVLEKKKSNNKINEKKVAPASTSRKSSTTKKTTSTAKKIDKASAAKKLNSTAKETNKVSTTTKSNTTAKKINKTSTTKKSNSTTKKATNQTTVKKATAKTKNNKVKNTNQIVEYYDLPYRYNKTMVKLLAQTPNSLFVYWDVSDKDIQNLKDKHGEDFFNYTKPVLLIHNKTKNYSYEVEINDFANCWYLTVPNSNSKYLIELGRKIIKKSSMNTDLDYIPICISNVMDAPNDHILLEQLPNTVEFKNIKTNSTSRVLAKDSSHNIREIYNVYDLYKQIYKDETILNNIGSSSLF